MSSTSNGLAVLFSASAETWLAVADAVLKATLLLAAAAATAVILQRASAALRHFVWTLALIGTIVLPALSTVLPHWQVPIVTLASPVQRAEVLTESAPSAPRSAARPSAPRPHQPNPLRRSRPGKPWCQTRRLRCAMFPGRPLRWDCGRSAPWRSSAASYWVLSRCCGCPVGRSA